MTRANGLRLSMVASLILGAAACGEAPSSSEPFEPTEFPVVNGTVTTQRPEVMEMTSPRRCSATLIGARDFLTAAHCFADQAQPGPGFTITNFQKRGGTVRVMTGTSCAAGCGAGLVCDGTMGVCARDFSIDRTFPQGVHTGPDDMAVGRLTAAVPGNLATPAQIAAAQPSLTNLTLVGFGCFARNLTDFGFKRFLTFFFQGQNTFNYCAGDSGSPTFLGFLNSNGAIVRIASAFDTSSGGADSGADTVTFRSQILAMANALEAGGISYRSQLQGIGFQGAVSNGTTSGTLGQNRRLEGIQIWSATPGVIPCYQAHVQGQGWQGQVCDGNLAGTVGQGLRMEALQIQLPQPGPFSRVRYRANVEGTFQPFVTSDQVCSSGPNCATGQCFKGRCAAGTVGQSRKIEAVEIFIE